MKLIDTIAKNFGYKKVLINNESQANKQQPAFKYVKKHKIKAFMSEHLEIDRKKQQEIQAKANQLPHSLY